MRTHLHGAGDLGLTGDAITWLWPCSDTTLLLKPCLGQLKTPPGNGKELGERQKKGKIVKLWSEVGLKSLGSLTPCFFEDLQSLRVHFDPSRGVKLQGLHFDQVEVGSKVNQEVDERRVAAVPQDGIHHTDGGAPGEALDVDGATAIEIGVGPGLEEQPEALQVVVGGADVERAHHQRGEGPQGEAGDARSQVVVHVHVCAVPGWERRDLLGNATTTTGPGRCPVIH